MIITAVTIPVVLFSLWVVSGYLPTRNIAMPTYKVISTHSDYEVRLYEPYIIAETSITSVNGSGGFNELFQYISGNNITQSKLSMTAPVLKSEEGSGEKLAMTAPVLKKEGATDGTIAFLMPSGINMDELPKPNSLFVTLQEIPGHKVAAITFSGFANTDSLNEHTERLKSALHKDGVHELSPPVTALYNPPWTPPFMRRNEILIEIE